VKGEVKTPNRMVFMYVPNGKVMPDWVPNGVGRNYELSKLLLPLAALKNDFNVITGLAADKARAHGDGGGDHARAMAAYLTGAQPYKTDGTDVRAGISVDQIAASRVGQTTRLPSLEIGSEPSNAAGSCDTGYSCVYNSTISWRSATTPLPKIFRPREVFNRLFGDSAISPEMERRKKSILDFVLGESHRLENRVGKNDRRKLDEYFTSIRDIELRMERASKMPPPVKPDYAVPTDIPEDFGEYMQIMADLIVLALQTDTTRVITYVVANEVSNRTYPEIGVRDGHHETSHHGNRPDRLANLRKINTYHIQQLAYMLKKMKAIKEGDGTLLDHSMVVYGSGNADGDRHDHDNLPTLVAGRGCGTIATGRHIHYERETPINNLWLSLLDRMDSPVETFGDGTGRLAELAG
jgi:hypothetical protein